MKKISIVVETCNSCPYIKSMTQRSYKDGSITVYCEKLKMSRIIKDIKSLNLDIPKECPLEDA